MKQKWVNPEDEKNPNGSFKHTAITPEDQLNKEKEEKENRKIKSEISTIGNESKGRFSAEILIFLFRITRKFRSNSIFMKSNSTVSSCTL